MAKITGKEGERFSGVAAVFDSEEDMLAALVRLPLPAHLPSLPSQRIASWSCDWHMLRLIDRTSDA